MDCLALGHIGGVFINFSQLPKVIFKINSRWQLRFIISFWLLKREKKPLKPEKQRHLPVISLTVTSLEGSKALPEMLGLPQPGASL